MFATILAIMFSVIDLGELFATKEAWTQSARDFESAHARDGFRATDASSRQISALGAGKCTYFQLPLWESRVYFTDAGVARVEMSLYNRGDAKGEVLAKEDLATLVDTVAKKIDLTGKPPRVERRENRSGGVQLTQKWSALANNRTAELTWGIATDKSADFVRLTIATRDGNEKKGVTKSVSGRAAQGKVKSNVTKNAEGDVWIANVPMVDQGQKGYCAAAVAERVLRYYGHSIDEHQIAQMAGSSAEGGTSVSEMIATVRTVGSKCRLGFNQVISMSGSMNDIKKEIELYNKSAKKLKKATIKFDDFLVGNTFMLPHMRDAMESDVILDMRAKDPRYKKFLAGVKKNIDQGIPVFWGVTLGMFPEENTPQARGGHMRLIIGYNTKTHELLFSDTWGAGHELKRVKEDYAFAMTHDAFILRPL